MNKLILIPAIASLALAVACGGASDSTDSSTSETPVTSTETTVSAADIPGLADIEINNDLVLEGNDLMQFDKNLLRVKAGETVKLTFKNVGELPKESMGHNVIVLKPGTDVNAFGGEAIKAVSTDYVPLTFQSSIVAHTKLLGPGETDVIEFTLEKGVYPYLCSFPGHYGIMQGQIVAE